MSPTEAAIASHIVGVIGASGFIGNRIVEMLHLDGEHAVRPIVRSMSGLALASRFGLAGRVADALDTAAMTRALDGCDIVVHALAGEPATIIGSVPTVYRAAQQARCTRLIYLSSAMVHGQMPPERCDEASPLPPSQRLPYNRAKVHAEARLFALARSGNVSATALRPGIVYGPRSQWIGGVADAMISGKSYLVGGGSGICNSVYVDNVVEAVKLCFDAGGIDGEAYLIGEHETCTWHELYARVASAIGFDVGRIPSVAFEPSSPTLKDAIDRVRRSRPVRAALASLPGPISRGLAAFWEASGALPHTTVTGPEPTLEMALLHQARNVPSWQKACNALAYDAPVPVATAWRRTAAWLSFAGYPGPGAR